MPYEFFIDANGSGPGRIARMEDPMPVTLDSGSVTIDNITVPTSVTVNNTSGSPVPVSDAGGTLSIDDGGGSITVDGPLTDVQLRATALPVSGPLTDAQLRASSVTTAPNISRGSGALDANTTRVTLATDSPSVASLTSIDNKTPALVNGRQPVEATVATRTPTTTSVTSTTSSTTILAANANRKGFCVSNISTSKAYLSFSTPATVANCFIEMQPGSFLVFDQQLIVGNAIYGIWTNAAGAAQVTEFV